MTGFFKIRNQEYTNVRKLQMFAHQISRDVKNHCLALGCKNMLAENKVRM